MTVSKEVNICYVTDNGYVMPTVVSIVSAIQNKKPNTVYNIYVITNNINEQNSRYIKQLDAETVRIFIKKASSSDRTLQNYKIKNISATSTSTYKFFIPELLDDIDKVIFIDGDTIVKMDLSDLFSTNLGDNYIGAVRDNCGIDNNVSDNHFYFNSGVMLMDLEKMRSNSVSNDLIRYRKTGYNHLMDQDAFNYVLRGKVLKLPFSINTQMNALNGVLQNRVNYSIEKINSFWGTHSQNVKQLLDDAVIIHYASAKPWKYCDGYGGDEWVYYYLLSPYKDTKLVRESYYLPKLAYSPTYKVGRKIIRPIRFLRGIMPTKKVLANKKFMKLFNQHSHKSGEKSNNG